MEYAWNKKKRTGVYMLMILGMVLSTGYIIFAFWMISVSMIFLGASIAYIVVMVLFIKMLILNYFFKIFRFEINNESIIIQYNERKVVKHLWDNISEVSVCDIHHATRGDAYDFAIRLVIGEEPDGPRNKQCKRNLYGYEKWRTDTYERKHRKQLIVIEYTPERYLKIKEASGMEIKDYRRPYSDAWKIKVPNYSN